MNVATAPKSSRLDFRTDHLMPDLEGRSVRGGAVTVCAQAANLVLQLGSTAVLARLLTPADFGLIAMVAAFTGVVSLFKDLGLSMATVQREHITHEQVSTLFWINVALSVLLMGVAAALAPAVAWFYREPRLTWIMLAVAGTFIFGGLSAQHTALLRRQMQFTRLSVIQVVSMGVGTGTAVVVGLLTRSYWALVCLPAASAATSAIGTWMISGWTPGRPRRGAGVRPMLSYGGHLTASSFMTYIAQNVDYLLLGYLWGPASVGLYRKSYELMMAPVRQLNAPIAAVMLPALSRLQGDSAGFSRSYLRTIQFLALAGMPLAAFSVVTADEIVQLLLGSEWAEAALLFRLLAPAAFLATIYSAPGYLFLALGQGNRQLRASVLDLIVTFTAVLAGLAWGAAGIAVAISTSVTVSFSLRTVYACRGTPVNLREILVALQPIVASSVGMGILVHLLRMTRESTTLAWFPLDLLLAGSLTFLLLNTSARGRELLRAVRRALRMGTPERNPHKSARSDLQLLESSQVSRPVS